MVRGDGHDAEAPMGSAASNLCLGPGWSTVCNTPFRKHKTWTHEGGICTPLIAHWPAGIDRSARGELRTAPGHVIDVVPTLLELAGQPAADRLPGHSLLPRFADKAAPTPHQQIWWHHDGHSSLRIGDWKLAAVKGGPWELYNLSADRTETTDLAAQHPERVKEMEQAWNDTADEFRQGVREE